MFLCPLEYQFGCLLVPILPEDTIKSLTKAIQRKEYAILPLAIEHVKQQLLQQVS